MICNYDSNDSMVLILIKKLLEKYKYNCANNAKSKGLLNNYNKKVFDFRSNFVKFMILKYIKKWCNYLKIM